MARPVVLLKYGEIALKGRNRGTFEKYLLRAVRRAVRDASAPIRVSRREGVVVLSGDAPREEMVRAAKQVLGVSVVQPGLRTAKSPTEAATGALQALSERFGEPGSVVRSFAVKARRRDKAFPMGSEKLAAFIGSKVVEEWGWPVNLGAPEVRIDVEVDQHEVFVTLDREQGQGGLPVGSSGRALVLLSGGFDSPVAAYRMMRRGLRCEFVHFTGAPLTGPSSTYKAYALVRQLDRFQGNSRLHVVPIGDAQRALATAGAGQLQIVGQRRLMMHTAGALAGELGVQAMVTGDSLGQVASQTLANLATVEQAAPLPLLRPLLAWDKDEIIAEADRIGTREISVLPDEDCCSLLAPPEVATRTTPEQFTSVEGRLELDELVPKLLTNVQVLTPGEPVSA